MSVENNQPFAPSRAGDSPRLLSRAGALRASSESNSSSRPEEGHSSLPLSMDKSNLFGGVARHTTIFADNTYSKPYFVTYVNSLFFAPLLLPYLVRYLLNSGGSWSVPFRKRKEPFKYAPVADDERNETQGSEDCNGSTVENGHIVDESDGNNLKDTRSTGNVDKVPAEAKINVRKTASLSFEFSILWFAANYFTASCLEYTSVSSSTILTSTSSIWTLLFAAGIGVEKFTWKKLIGVLASFAGVVVTSTVDFSGDNDENRGSFPHKSSLQIGVGDALALLSAVLYGIYTTMMKKRIGDEARVNMSLFFGFVGLFNTVTLLPGFLIMHLTGIEPFALPPTSRIWAIILINSAASLVSDFCWAYSMLLTTPLVVTVGLSLTIPLSLVGQIMLNSQGSSVTYWIGAGIVFLSFLFINHESRQQESVLDDP